MEGVVYNLEIEYCVQCPFHRIVADPDPDDWFEDDDQALICTHKDCPRDYTEVQTAHYESRRLSKYGRVISSGDRPYYTPKIKVPIYCPLRKA